MPLPLQDGSGSDQQSQQQCLLLQASQAFCASFAQKSKTPAEIVEAHFSSSSSSSSPDGEITAYEHGLPELGLPFLGRAFRGRDGVRAYFETVAACLSYADMRFPAAASARNITGTSSGSEEQQQQQQENRNDDDDDDDAGRGGWVVDAAARKVSVKGSAEFTWTATGESWREVFAYVLTFDADRKAPKVRTYEVWADTGAAWLASRGETREGEEGKGGTGQVTMKTSPLFCWGVEL